MLFSPPRVFSHRVYYAKCKWPADSKKIRKRDQKRAEYIKNQGYDIEITRECEYHQLLNACPEFKEFIETQRQQRPLEHRITLTEQEILSAIRDKKKIFGAVEVDMHVLDNFGEMSPIFCNEEIPFEAVGEYTQNNARKLQFSENPRRLLVGGVRARKIVLATPLLK